MSHASSSKIHNYDVFLSFRGEDTRETFVSPLYDALIQGRINVFEDAKRIELGQSIRDELPEAIEESKIAIVIFSKSFASSEWCLNELAHIMKCHKEMNQIVIPIFYYVNPTDVSHQNPPFAEWFSKYEKNYKDNKEKVQRWRDAFAMIGEIKGIHLKYRKDEADFIKTVVCKLKPLLHMESGYDDVQRGMPAESPILIDGGKVSSSLDKKTKKKCFMIAARRLEIVWGDNPDYWEWLPHPDSRFAEVAKLRRVTWLDIRGKIETPRLSKGITYVAYLVFKLLESNFRGLETVRAVVRFVDSHESVEKAAQRASAVHFKGGGPTATRPFKRDDGWMELKMGDFYNDIVENGVVEARLMETVHREEKAGLIVQGVEFRPE